LGRVRRAGGVLYLSGLKRSNLRGVSRRGRGGKEGDCRLWEK